MTVAPLVPFTPELAQRWREGAAAAKSVLRAVAAVACAPFPLLPPEAPFGSDLLEKFGDAKARMLAWPAALLPEIAAMPRHVAQFASIWQSLFSDLDRGLAKTGASPGAATDARRSLIAMLLQAVRTEQQRAAMVARAVEQWRTTIEDDRVALAAIRAEAERLGEFDESHVRRLLEAADALAVAIDAAGTADSNRIRAVLVWVDVITGSGFAAFDDADAVQRDPRVVAAHRTLVDRAGEASFAVRWAALFDVSLASIADAYAASARVYESLAEVAAAWEVLDAPIADAAAAAMSDPQATSRALAQLAAAREPMLVAAAQFAELAAAPVPDIEREVVEFR